MATPLGAELLPNSEPKSVDQSAPVVIRVPESAGQHYERIQYPAGELQIRLTPGAISTLYGSRDVTVICRSAHQHLMELALLSDALHALCGHLDTTLVLPYLPYGRADRRFTEGDCHGLKTFGSILDWTLGYNRVKTLDAHSFRAAKNVAHLEDISARNFITRAMADIADRTGHLPALLLPDQGAARYKFSEVVQCAKRRDPATGQLSGFEVPEFERQDALIVDDICDGGGTFIGLAQEINRMYGPSITDPASERYKRLSLYVTHGIFSRGLKELLGYFEKVYTTDSVFQASRVAAKDFEVHRPELWGKNRLEVYDCEPLLLEAK
jgi:ribose-phosphate pyrophosphokinase